FLRPDSRRFAQLPNRYGVGGIASTARQNELFRADYLGHWSSDGVIVVPYSAAAAFLNSEHVPYVKYAVARGNPFIKGNVYYPVENIDFRRWSEMHGRGGDFIIYSDKKYIPISPFIKIRL
ncbi:DUF6402 family protein, partial [Burkholderia cenocepacia]|uniref:DUF6402 family protein n=1 Tax=Burkholderia cenocepacia TaxID=95486 RepID=UPI001F45101A